MVIREGGCNLKPGQEKMETGRYQDPRVISKFQHKGDVTRRRKQVHQRASRSSNKPSQGFVSRFTKTRPGLVSRLGQSYSTFLTSQQAHSDWSELDHQSGKCIHKVLSTDN